MTVIARKKNYTDPNSLRVIIMLSAWGFSLVLASLLFLWLGYLLDKLLGTSPKFMIGIFSLAIIGCFIELYQEALKIMKNTRR
jgi:F0F1-type ATP synthase assembly protein I